ncbi:MAG: class I SAM-dependent methyltransferase [Campylobacterales bacterium]
MNDAANALQWFLNKNGSPFKAADSVAIVNAQPGAFLKTLGNPVMIQGFFPDFTACQKAGFETLVQMDDRPLRGAVLFGSKHKEENLFYLAALADRLEPGGTLIAVAPKDLGGKTLAKNAAALLGGGTGENKHHCTVFMGTKQSPIDPVWLSLGEPKQIEGGYFTVPGIFCHDHIDTGSKLLFGALETQLIGPKVADLGAGWGYLSGELLKSRPQIESLTLFEADFAAVRMARLNITDPRAAFEWCDVTAGVGQNRFDTVVMNPPFHAKAAASMELGQSFIRAAFSALKNGGTLYLVANRHLPYEATLETLFAQVTVLRDERGFKVISARR